MSTVVPDRVYAQCLSGKLNAVYIEKKKNHLPATIISHVA